MNLAWYVTRAAGLVSWAILALAVLWGLLLSSKVLGRQPGPKWLLDVHRFLGALSVVFVAVHVVALLLDDYVPFRPTQLLVPFTSDYRPAAVAAGVVGLYLLVAVEVTSLLRRRLPRRWWRGIHLLSYGLFVLGTVHLLTAGTDARNPAVLATVITTSAVVAAGTAAHAVRLRSTRGRRSATVPAAPSAPSLVLVDLDAPAVAPAPTGDAPAAPGRATVDASAWTLPERPPVREGAAR